MSFDLYDAVRAEQFDNNRALVEKLCRENPQVKSELIWIFWKIEPSIISPKKSWPLRVVSDEKRRQVEDLLWTQIVTLQDTKAQQLITLEHENPFQALKYIAKPSLMTPSELALFSAMYFSEPQARDMFVRLFMQEKDNQWVNLKHNLSDLYERVFDDEPTNIYGFWTTEKQDPIKIRLQRLLSGEQKRLFEYEYSYAKVRKKHGRFWDSFFVRLAKTLWWHIWLRKTEVIAFPWEYKKSHASTQEAQSRKLDSETPEIIQKAFVSMMIELAHLSENIEWYVWARKEAYIPDEIKKQLLRMEELEVLWWLYNYHQHIESNLAMIIGYYYPEIAHKYSKQRWKDIKSVWLEKYPSREDIDIVPRKIAVIKQEARERKDDTIILEMKQSVAEHFWFTDSRKLRCSPKLLEYIMSLPDEEAVVFSIWGKKVQINAKMFRRVFHRERLPTQDETNTILPFTR